MANWCSNQITLSGRQDRVEKLLSYFIDLRKNSNHSSIDVGDYIFDLEIEGDTLFFETKWNGSERFARLIETFGVAFDYYAEERGCGYYMQYKYNPDINARCIKYLEQDDKETDEDVEEQDEYSWNLIDEIKDIWVINI